MTAPLPPRRKASFGKSLQIAIHGASFVLRTERNAQIESVIAVIAIGLGLLLRITAVEWAILFVLIGVVLALEVFNTAVEATVDLATDQYHDLARIAKDAAAGAVLIMAITSVAVGIVIFAPRLWRLISTLLA